MAKFELVKDWSGAMYVFQCPGCKCSHYVQTAKNDAGQPVWKWNGDVDKPTVTPSIRVQTEDETGKKCCHFFITNGQIRFCGDCTHELSGKTLELEDW